MAQSSGKIRLGNDFEDTDIQHFLESIKQLILDEVLVKGTSRESRVTNFKHPGDLKAVLELDINAEQGSYDELVNLCRSVTHYSVKTANPRFFNQLFSGMNVFGLAGSWLTESLNTNIHTYETSPVFVLIDNYMIQKMCGIVGYPDGDGLFNAGGAFSNIMALNVARYKVCPDVKTEGIYIHKRMKVYVSAEGHYSLVKGSIFLGMGSKSVVKVDSDERGRMIPEALERLILRDKENVLDECPMCVVATSGTTVLGAFDPLDNIADVCERHNVWLHCDACWGGGALLSPNHKHLLTGIHRTNSVSWNMHKTTSAPMQCALYLVKEKGLLEACNRVDVEYLFQPDKCYDTSYDIGHKTVQCGRKVDSLKLWLMWKGLGDSGMATIVDKAFTNARYLKEKIHQREGFRLVMPDVYCLDTYYVSTTCGASIQQVTMVKFEYLSVCFWFIPKSLRGKEETREWWEAVSLVGPKVKERMFQDGTIMICYQPLATKDWVNFFRMVVGNSKCTFSDMDFVINEIERMGKDL